MTDWKAVARASKERTHARLASEPKALRDPKWTWAERLLNKPKNRRLNIGAVVPVDEPVDEPFVY